MCKLWVSWVFLPLAIGIKVKPIIGLLDEMPILQGNPDEIESIFTVPLDVFLQQKPNYQHKVKYMGLIFLCQVLTTKVM
jgi:hypothetical protein